MGFADMLLKLGIPYNSEEAVEVAEKVMAFIQQESKQASAALADQRGNFSTYPGSKYDGNGVGRMRNATTTTIAPTGTISIISGCSSGIEPLFAVSYVRRVMEGTELVEVHPYFEELAKSRGFYSPELMKSIAQSRLHPGLPGNPQGRAPPLRHRPRGLALLAHPPPGAPSRNTPTTPCPRR